MSLKPTPRFMFGGITGGPAGSKKKQETELEYYNRMHYRLGNYDKAHYNKQP